MSRVLFLLLVLTFSLPVAAQTFKDGRNTPSCTACEQLFKSKPKEVQFGVRLDAEALWGLYCEYCK